MMITNIAAVRNLVRVVAEMILRFVFTPINKVERMGVIKGSKRGKYKLKKPRKKKYDYRLLSGASLEKRIEFVVRRARRLKEAARGLDVMLDNSLAGLRLRGRKI